MALPRILVLVLAGGAGGRLELLTEQRAKPAVPFAGVYRRVLPFWLGFLVASMVVMPLLLSVIEWRRLGLPAKIA